jgi:hypothetical protein
VIRPPTKSIPSPTLLFFKNLNHAGKRFGYPSSFAFLCSQNLIASCINAAFLLLLVVCSSTSLQHKPDAKQQKQLAAQSVGCGCV